MRLFVRPQRFDGGLRLLVPGSQGPCWRAAFLWSARSRPWAVVRDFGAGTRPISRLSGAAITRRESAFTPTSTPTAGTPAAICAGVPAARWTMTWNEQNHRPVGSSDRVADRMRAVPAPIRRASFRVDSCVRIRPRRGRVTWRRLASARIVPVVNRTDRRERADLNTGKPAAFSGALSLARPVPRIKPPGEGVQAAVICLLRVLRPPRGGLVLAPVPLLAKPRQRPAQRRRQVSLGDAVGALRRALVHDGLHQRKHRVVGLACTPGVRPERPLLRRGGIQREAVRLRRPPFRDLEPSHRRPPRPARASPRSPRASRGSARRAGRTAGRTWT